jgi:hypothetical protein
MAEVRRRAVASAGLVIASALIAVLLILRFALPPAPPPGLLPASRLDDAQPAASTGTEAAAIASEVRRSALSSGTGGIAGVVSDAFGVPAPRVGLILQRPQPVRARRLVLDRPLDLPATWGLVSDAEGAFAQGGLDPGDYTLDVTGADLTQVLRVEPDAVTSVSLHLPRGKVLTTGCIVRGGKRAPAHVRVGVNYGFADADGWITMLLPPGRHLLEVMRTGSEQVRELVLGRHELFVPEDTGTLRYEFPLRGADVVAAAESAAGPHRHQVALIVTGTPELGGEPVSMRSAGAEGTAGLPNVPPGRWQAVMLGTHLQRTEPQSFEIGADTEHVALSFAAVAGATVFLVLRTADGRPPKLPFAALPRLATTAGPIAAEDLRGVLGAPAHTKAGYLGVPAGAAELLASDPEPDGEVTFLGVEVPAGVSLLVRPQSNEILTVDVVPRPRVELVAADASGREDSTARLSLFAGARRVRAPVPGRGSQWHGWLPTGSYRVVIERGSARRDHEFAVGRSDVRLRLRP